MSKKARTARGVSLSGLTTGDMVGADANPQPTTEENTETQTENEITETAEETKKRKRSEAAKKAAATRKANKAKAKK